MNYSVVIGSRARRDMESLERDIAVRISERIRHLATDAHPPGCAKLKARTPEAWRIRVGDYRVIYQIDESARQVKILHVGHRRDVYN